MIKSEYSNAHKGRYETSYVTGMIDQEVNRGCIWSIMNSTVNIVQYRQSDNNNQQTRHDTLLLYSHQNIHSKSCKNTAKGDM